MSGRSIIMGWACYSLTAVSLLGQSAPLFLYLISGAAVFFSSSSKESFCIWQSLIFIIFLLASRYLYNCDSFYFPLLEMFSLVLFCCVDVSDLVSYVALIFFKFPWSNTYCNHMFIPGNKNLGRDHRYAVASILSTDEVGPVFNY